MATTRSNAVRKTNNVASFSLAQTRQFGVGVGKGDATAVEKSDELHEQFKHADSAERSKMRNAFITGYIMGRLGVEYETADEMRKTPRAKAKKDVALAQMAGSQKFKYLIDRSGNKAKGKARGKQAGKYNVKVKVTPQMRALADKLFGLFPKAKDLDEQFRMVKAALDQIVKAEKDAAKEAANDE